MRDGDDGLEALMVQRNRGLEFGAGAWVFPGGRVDPGDWPGELGGDEVGAARRAAAREAFEETGLDVAVASLVPFSHWTPPPGRGHRFATWFFLGAAPAGAVVVDGGEIVDHAWMRPAAALEAHRAGDIQLLPPTWITLATLSRHPDVAAALAAAGGAEPERFATRFATVEEGMVALYHGDAGYESSDPSAPGGRHRLWMVARQWRYERDADA